MTTDLPRSRRARFAGALAVIVWAVSSPAAAQTYECGYYDWEPGYIGNGDRGDVLLTRVEGSPAGAVTDPLGQVYTHAGILMDPWSVRHNTSLVSSVSLFDSFWGAAPAFVTSLFSASACYDYTWVPMTSLRRGLPGLATDSVSKLSSLLPWNPGYLHLLKPKDEGAYRARALDAAAALEDIAGMVYDVHSYQSYDETIGANGSMCSGAVKRATDLAGHGGFDLVDYTPEEVNVSAASLFNYMFDRAFREIERKSTKHVLGIPVELLSHRCREYMAAGIANEVVSCFVDGSCGRGGTRDFLHSYVSWRVEPIGGARSISPDNLVFGQPRSLYAAVVTADYHAGRWVYVSQTCSCADVPPGEPACPID